MSLFGKKKMCLMCGKKMKQEHASIKYRYEQEKIGTAYLCKPCTDRLEEDKEHDHVESI